MSSEILGDDEVAELQARPSTELGGYRRVLLRPRERDALCATVRALREKYAQLADVSGEWARLLDRIRTWSKCADGYPLDEHINNIVTKYESLKSKIAWHRDGVGPDVPVLQERYDRLIATNTALREQLVEAQQLAETRSDIIAAKAAHVDQLQSQLTEHSTSNLLRRLKDFLFDNCNHSERDRNYDWCPTCVMAFVEVLAQPSNSELQSLTLEGEAGEMNEKVSEADARLSHEIAHAPAHGNYQDALEYRIAHALTTTRKEAREAAFAEIGVEMRRYGANIRKVDLMARFQELFREKQTQNGSDE